MCRCRPKTPVDVFSLSAGRQSFEDVGLKSDIKGIQMYYEATEVGPLKAV